MRNNLHPEPTCAREKTLGDERYEAEHGVIAWRILSSTEVRHDFTRLSFAGPAF